MLADHLVNRLEETKKHVEELSARLMEPEVAANHIEFSRINREVSSLRKSVDIYDRYCQALSEIEEAKSILADGSSDPEFRELASEQLADGEKAAGRLSEEIRRSLVSEDPDDLRHAIVEIRAGAGGDEAALWAGDLFRMYRMAADRKKLRIEVIEMDGSEQGGYKEIKFMLKGKGSFGRMRFDSGVHRVQRVPKTETQGRIHTSTASVAVLPEVEEVEIDLNERDIEMEAMRAGGPGGQNVNKTSSAVRLTHVPTGLVVKCQADPSQHKNRATAMRLLKAKLFELERAKAAAERSSARASQIGTGDRSEKIRTYNYKDNRVTDHRIKLTLHTLPDYLNGEVDALLEAMRQAEVEERLAAL